MVRNLFLFIIIFSSSLYAWQPKPAINIIQDIEEPTGFNAPIAVRFTLSINGETVNPDLIESEVELKIFIPPAMQLQKGDLRWNGNLKIGEKEVFDIQVKATLEKPLIYDVGAVVLSDMLEDQGFIAIRESIYLEKNRGTVWDEPDLQKQFEKTPWLRENIPYSEEIITDEKGKERKKTSFIVGVLQQNQRLDGMTWQEARPNKLYQEEWINYLRELKPEKEITTTSNLKKKGRSDSPQLSTINAVVCGVLRNSTGGMEDVRVKIHKKNTTSGWTSSCVFTDDGGKFDLFFDDTFLDTLYHYCPNIITGETIG